EPTENNERGDAEGTAPRDRGVELRIVRRPSFRELVQELTEPLVADPEEVLGDDCADNRQAGGNAKAGEHGWRGAGEFELAEPGPAAGSVQGEEVVVGGVSRLQTEERVGDDRKEGDDHDDDDAGPEPLLDEEDVVLGPQVD